MVFHRLAHFTPEGGFLGQSLFAEDLLHGETSAVLPRCDTVRLPIESDKRSSFVNLKNKYLGMEQGLCQPTINSGALGYRPLNEAGVQGFIWSEEYGKQKKRRFGRQDILAIAENEAFLCSDPDVLANIKKVII